MNIEVLDTIARSFGLCQFREIPGTYHDEHGQPAVALECASSRYIHLFEVFRIEDKMSEAAGISIMLFPSLVDAQPGEQQGVSK